MNIYSAFKISLTLNVRKLSQLAFLTFPVYCEIHFYFYKFLFKTIYVLVYIQFPVFRKKIILKYSGY